MYFAVSERPSSSCTPSASQYSQAKKVGASSTGKGPHWAASLLCMCVCVCVCVCVCAHVYVHATMCLCMCNCVCGIALYCSQFQRLQAALILPVSLSIPLSKLPSLVRSLHDCMCWTDVMLRMCVGMYNFQWSFLLFCVAEEVLVQFRDQFIRSMDADAVVYDLEYEGIISNGDLTKITTTPDTAIQNKILHACLKRKCDKDALARVCDMIITVQDNPKMAALGREMKCQLHKCKCSGVFSACVCVSAFVHTNKCVCVYIYYYYYYYYYYCYYYYYYYYYY